MKDSSWENSQKWYNDLVGPSGHYYHTEIVLPNTLRLLSLTPDSKLLDMACGQGVLSRAIPKIASYTGYDLSPSLIQEAKKLNRDKSHQFFVQDAEKALPSSVGTFTHGSCLLALQNIPSPKLAIQSLAPHLQKGARFVCVLNHPCFRIPRMSGWQVDTQKKLQSRRLDVYMSPQKIPMATHPSDPKSETTWSFHHPLSYFFDSFKSSGFYIETLEEWCSNKTSSGKMASAENRARKEFPLFLAIVAIKKE